MRFKAAIPAAEIVRLCRVLLPGPDDDYPSGAPDQTGLLSMLIEAVDSPEASSLGSLTFLGSDTTIRIRQSIQASLVLAEPGVDVPKGINTVRVPSIHAAMSALLLATLDRLQHPEPFSVPTKPVSQANILGPGAIVEGYLEGDVHVGPGAYIGKGTYIGSGSRIGANATILDNCRLGRNCIVQPGAVIGCAGFGFFPGDRGLQAMPHIAGVEIGEDCWIGANTVIAAGVLNPTTLGKGCKLDSHVQIAHNVRLGDQGLLASQSGVAGSTTIGQRFQMGGAASIDGHLRIGDDVSVAACAGVTKDLPDKMVVAGFPARPISEWRRQQVGIKRLVEQDRNGKLKHG